GGVTVLDAQVVVLEVNVEVGVDQALLDELPDDPRHLVTVELDNSADNLDLRHTESLLVCCYGRKHTVAGRAAPASRSASLPVHHPSLPLLLRRYRCTGSVATNR